MRPATLPFSVKRALILSLALLAAPHCCDAVEYDEPIEKGHSPDRQFDVVNIHNGEGGYFVIRNSAGETVFSEKSLPVTFAFANAASEVLWRADSRFVAISFSPSKFSDETVVFYRDGQTLRQVELPDYEPESENTHRHPHRWLKNGDLVLDVTSGYHTKSDGGISGYFATVHFAGSPPKASKHSRTKVTNRD